MSTPVKKIVAGFKSLLDADNSVKALLSGGIHCRIIEKPSYPYIKIGDCMEDKFNTFGRDGKETTVFVFAYSEKDTDSELMDIVDAVDDVLDDVSLSISGWSTVLVSWENTKYIESSDTRSRHAIIEYRVITQKGS